MTESADTAGALLRAAREKQGLHVAALAMMLKVPPRKLEALEAGRYEELQGATFVRALAQAACRALKIDPAPVLRQLPEQDGGTLSQLERGLNTPFRERGGAREGLEPGRLLNPMVAVVAVLLLGAVAFWLWPSDWRPWPAALPTTELPAVAEQPSAAEPAPAPLPGSAPQADATAASEPLPATAGITPPASAATAVLPSMSPSAAVASTAVAAAPGKLPAASTPVTPSPGSGGPVQVRARERSWVEVIDAHGRVLLGRTLAAGETVELDGTLPLRVKIGNAAGTELSFRGRSVPLVDDNGDDVVRLELK